MTKNDAINAITKSAKEYASHLENMNMMFLFGTSQNVTAMEAMFLSRHFFHLTGVAKHNSISVEQFYQRYLAGTISANEINLKSDGTSEIKLQVLPNLMRIHKSAKMVGDYNGSKPVLYTEKLVGNVSACLGFQMENDYYVSNTALNADIRDLTKIPQQRILAIFRKPITEVRYSELCYLGKGVVLESVVVPPTIQARLDLVLLSRPPSVTDKLAAAKEQCARQQAERTATTHELHNKHKDHGGR